MTDKVSRSGDLASFGLFWHLDLRIFALLDAFLGKSLFLAAFFGKAYWRLGAFCPILGTWRFQTPGHPAWTVTIQGLSNNVFLDKPVKLHKQQRQDWKVVFPVCINCNLQRLFLAPKFPDAMFWKKGGKKLITRRSNVAFSGGNGASNFWRQWRRDGDFFPWHSWNQSRELLPAGNIDIIVYI